MGYTDNRQSKRPLFFSRTVESLKKHSALTSAKLNSKTFYAEGNKKCNEI